MAQYIGLVPAQADRTGQPQQDVTTPFVGIVASPLATTTTADIQSHIVTNQDMIQGLGGASEAPSSTSPSRTKQLLAACITLAGRSVRTAHRFRYELAPICAVSILTGLGWWQHYAAGAGWATAGYATAGILAATVSGYGLKLQHHHVFAGGAGLAVALGDVTTAVATGPSAASATAAALTTGLAYAVHVPLLIQHRKDEKADAKAKELAKPGATGELNTAPATEIVTPEPEATPVHSRFHDATIPYAPDSSTDIATPIRIGWDENGQPVYLTMLYRHTLIAGASDWGKSGLMNLIIKKLLAKDHVDLYGIDLKAGAPELGPWAPLFKRLARTPEEARDLLQYLGKEYDRRGAHLEHLSNQSLAAGGPPVKKWIPGDPSHPDPKRRGHGSAIFCITDELGELIRQDEELRKGEAEARRADPEGANPAEPAITTTYESALALHRFLCIQYISLTQQPSSRVFGGNTDARGNYANRLCTRVAETIHAQYVFGQKWQANGFNPAVFTRPGEFFLAAPEMPQTDPPRCRAEYVTDQDIGNDVSRYFQAGHQPAAQQTPAVPRLQMVKAPVKPAGPTYPDGTAVPRTEWPDLYAVFLRLCSEQGYAIKDDLTREGPYDSRDTVRRAVEVWLTRGVQVRKAGRTEQFYLPTDSDD